MVKKIMKKTGNIKKFYQYAFPMQAAILTCIDKNGRTNPITVAWHTPISKNPPLYGVSIAPSRFSHKLIKDSKEFVINFAPFDIVEKINLCGIYSGRNIDKMQKTELTLIDAKKVKSKIIKQCFAHLECRLFKTINLGDHDFFVGEVINTIIDKNAFENDILDNKKIKPCYYLGGNIYTKINDVQKSF
jgi:flavin reductase (DIM6/NTAB) family NADH-FMN oxidoreductase RutF